MRMDLQAIMNTKRWMIGVGALATFFGLMNYVFAETVAGDGWGNTMTPHDVFYEAVWGLLTAGMGLTCIATGMLVTGRALPMMAMIGAGVQFAMFGLMFSMAQDISYALMTPGNLAPGIILMGLLALSGYLHLEDGEEAPAKPEEE
jgi:hypothetical protein